MFPREEQEIGIGKSAESREGFLGLCIREVLEGIREDRHSIGWLPNDIS